MPRGNVIAAAEGLIDSLELLLWVLETSLSGRPGPPTGL